MNEQKLFYIIQCAGFVNSNIDCEFVGQYLENFDIEKPAKEVMVYFTKDINRALIFESVQHAMSAWMTQRMYDGGLRPDGRPDRPLTAISIDILPLHATPRTLN